MDGAHKLKVELPSEREACITRWFDAPRELVWRCHTEPALVRRWMLGPPGWSLPVCEIDLRVGGRYRYVWRNEDGRDMGMGGVFRELAAPERIVSTELFDEDWTGGETTVTQVLTEQGGKTLSTMTILYASQAARDGALKTGMTDGMEMSYGKLDEIVAELAAR